MSLIFKALQRFRSSDGEMALDPTESAPKRNTITMRKILLSPPLALFAAATIFLVGLLASQAITMFPHKEKEVAPSVAEGQPEEKTAPDDVATNQAAAEADSQFQLSKPDSIQKSQEVTFKVHPPERVEDRAAPSVMNASVAAEEVRSNFSDFGAAVMEGGDSPQESPAATTDGDGLKSDKKEAALSPPLKKRVDSKFESVGDTPTRVLSVMRYNTVSSAGSLEVDAAAATPPSAVLPKRAKGVKPNRTYQLRATQATRHLQISQLANKIQGAILANNVQLTSDLLAKLTRIIGRDSAFVLKLKAYSLIRQERLEEARAILSKVLTLSAGDLEAGLNMAVVDIKSGRFDSARRRLIRLQGEYPENSNITTYLRQLPR